MEFELGAWFEGACGFALVLALSQMMEHGPVSGRCQFSLLTLSSNEPRAKPKGGPEELKLGKRRWDQGPQDERGKAEILKAETLKSDPPPPGYGGQARLGCGTARQGAEIRELGFVEWARKLLLSCP